MDIIIKKASADDAEEILEYLKKIGSETDNLSFGGEGLPFSPEAEAAYLSQLEGSSDGVMLVAKANGRIVGDASLSRLPRRMGHRGDFGVSVLKEYWGNGIGRQLLCAILDFAKANDFEVIDLQVRSDNERAIRLYEKYGFQKIGTHPTFFKLNGKDVSFDYMYLKIR